MTKNILHMTHPDKIMYPDANIRKADIVDYYTFIAPYMIPYIKDRPLSLKQFPGGIAHAGFFHKHAATFYPDYIQRFNFPSHHHGDVEMIGVNNAEGLAYLAMQNTIEIHSPLAKIKTHDKPDQIILDFDPSDDDFAKVREVALVCKQILDDNKLEAFVKTTGSRGLHIHIPLKPIETYATIKPIAKQLAQHVQQQCPDIATIEFHKNKRGNKVFIDYLRNDHAATAVAVYSLRANKWAGIATPVSWDRLKNDKKLLPYTYNINNIREYIKGSNNPWQNFTVG